MGRPLSKKFFGNRNIGSTSTTSDNGIGGEGVASAAISVAGSYTTLPTFTFTAPQLPNGVTATGVVVSEVLSATISGGTGYGTSQTFDLTVTTAGGTAIINVTSTAEGAIDTVNSITTRGTFTSLGPVTSISGGIGDNAAVPVLIFRASAVTITESGSGYTSAPTIAGYTSRGGITVNAITLTTDSGNVGSSTNQENAIQITAWVPETGAAGNISGNGTSAVTGDIVRQCGSKKYIVKTAQGIGRVSLVAATPGAGEATIIAIDANNNNYYVTKLTTHKAQLTQIDGGSNYVYSSGDFAQWSFANASGLIVKIENA